MYSSDLATAVRAVPHTHVIRAVLHSYHSPVNGLVASLLLLEHRVEGNTHQTFERVVKEWGLSPFSHTRPEPHIIADVYRRMVATAQTEGAHELHIEFPPECFTGDELTSQKVRDLLTIPETLMLHIYALQV